MSVWGDARVTRYVGGPFDAETVRARLEREIAAQASDGFQYWPMFELDGGAHVGCSGLKRSRSGDGVLEIGFYLRPEHWGRGLASEAARAVMDYGFDVLGARALFAGHHPENEGSRRVILGLGFRYSHHEHYAPTGLEHPGYVIERDGRPGHARREST